MAPTEIDHDLGSGFSVRSQEGRALIFTRTRRGARQLARQLAMAGTPAAELHGDLAQGAPPARRTAPVARPARPVLAATPATGSGAVAASGGFRGRRR
jgi:superfamily II helicase